jgi:hypothetical protein
MAAINEMDLEFFSIGLPFGFDWRMQGVDLQRFREETVRSERQN